MWELGANGALLTHDVLAAKCTPAAPSQGVYNLSVDRRAIAGNILSIRPTSTGADPPLVEHYGRGNDLVTAFAQTPQLDFRYTIYYRLVSLKIAAGVFPAIDVMIALQTRLLDTVPRVMLCSELECDECIFRPTDPDGEDVNASELQQVTGNLQTIDAPGCVMWRFNELNTTYIEMVHPHDFVSAEISKEDRRHALRWDLMGHFMEKGVIRRLQSRGAFVPLENDHEAAAAAFAEFTRRPPPLAT